MEKEMKGVDRVRRESKRNVFYSTMWLIFSLVLLIVVLGATPLTPLTGIFALVFALQSTYEAVRIWRQLRFLRRANLLRDAEYCHYLGLYEIGSSLGKKSG
jgi:hypothetical protein